jgi:F0F1-type ATP synthase delta subunit
MFGTSSFAQTPFATLAGTANALFIVEGIQLGDASTQLSAFLQTRVEPIAMGDVNSTAGLFFGSVTENLNSGDASTQAATFLQSISENSRPADVATIAAQFAQSVAENSRLADTPVPFAAFLQSLTENFSLTDTSAIGAQFTQAVTENFRPADSIAITAQFAQSLSENITLADLPAIAAQFAQAVTENFTAADSSTIVLVFIDVIVENLSVADSATVVSLFFESVFENLNSADAAAVLSTFQVAITENTTLADSAAVAGWLKIINDQSANWTLITPVNTLEVYSGWSSSASNGVTAVALNGFYSTGLVTPYAVSTQNGPWLYRQINGQNLSNIRYVNGNFYAFSTLTSSPNQLYRSADGFTWTQLQAPNPARPIRAIFGNGTQLIVQQNSTQIYLSTDNGATWATNTIAFAAGLITAAVWDGAKYVYNNGRRIFTSSDGAVWTFRYGSAIVSERSSLAWNGAYFVAVFQGANSNIGSVVARSTDGVSWTTLYSIGWMSIVFNFGNTFAVALRDGGFYSLDPATNNYAALGTNTGYIYDAFAPGDFGVSLYHGEYILPAYNLTAVNQLPASSNLVTFTPEPVSFWAGVDDSQNPNWQNINT